MSARKTTMRKIYEILRLNLELKLGVRKTARSLNLSVGVVQKYISQAKAKQLSWPLPEGITDSELELLLKDRAESSKASSAKSRIDFTSIHEELRRKGVTLELLWQEYASQDEKPLSYSRYCYYYREWKERQKRSMRQAHRAGEKLFIDYSGQTMAIIDPETGQVRKTEIFVGVLGASSYTYAEATWSQQLPDFLAAQSRMLEFYGGVPELIVPDNLKSAVTHPCYYDPDINPTYAQFIAHYGTAVLPARPYRPKDKAMAESGVQVVQRWILAKLRHQTFVGLAQLNAAIKTLLADLNDRPFQKRQGSRTSAFEKLDKPALKPLPAQAYRYRQYQQVRVGIDYHVRLNQHYYSVPHRYCGEKVDLWFNQETLECYYKGERIATHLYSNVADEYSTLTAHMPKRHQKQQACSKEMLLQRAKDIGLHTQVIAKSIFQSKAHQEQGYRCCLGLLKLKDTYGEQRLELACQYAVYHQLASLKSIVSILDSRLDYQSDPLDVSCNTIAHDNIRGALYYH